MSVAVKDTKLPPFLRPVFSYTPACPPCVFCGKPLTLADFCKVCHFRLCPHKECARRYVDWPLHKADQCLRDAPGHFEADVLAFLSVDDNSSDMNRANPLLVSAHIHQMREQYTVQPSLAGETARLMKWRDEGFPPIKPDMNLEFLKNMPTIKSDYPALMSLLFHALVMRHDGSTDSVVQNFYIGFIGNEFRKFNCLSLVDDVIKKNPVGVQAVRQLLLTTNRRDAKDANKVFPYIQIACSCDDSVRPGILFPRLMSRPAVNSLLLIEVWAESAEEAAYFLRKGARPPLFFSQTLLVQVAKYGDSALSMRVMQAHRDFYDVGQWLMGRLPESKTALATLDPEPAAAKRLVGRIEIMDFVRALDTLVKPTTSATERRDAYAKVTGIHLCDASGMPTFRFTVIEADLTH